MKRQVKKELKKYPYKSRLPLYIKRRDSYAIVDKEENVVGKFRLKQTAIEEIRDLKKRFGQELRIIEL